MKKTIHIFLSLSIYYLCSGQTYLVQPNHTLNIEQGVGSTAASYIFFKNNADSGLVLKWKLLETNIENTDWQVALCDYDQCYVGVPDSGIMRSLDLNQNGFLKPNVVMSSPGEAYYTFTVCDQTNPNQKDTITFNYKATYPQSVNEYNKDKVLVYPQPSSDVLYLKTDGNDPINYRVFNLQGKLMKNGKLEEHIDISILPRGEYILDLKTNDNITIEKLLFSKI